MHRIVCLLLALPLLISSSDKPAVWQTDLPAALAAARAKGLPVFVVFRCEY